MIKRARRLSLTLLIFLSAGFAASLRAETVGYPKDKPVLTIDLPSGWKVDWIEAGALPGGSRVQFQTDGGAADLSIKALPAGAEVSGDATAKASVAKLAMQDMKDFEASKCSDPTETTVAGHKAYSTKVTTGIGPMEYTIFTPDGKTYLAMFSMNGGAEPIIALIKTAE
jgi:hypothetical protein